MPQPHGRIELVSMVVVRMSASPASSGMTPMSPPPAAARSPRARLFVEGLSRVLSAARV